MYKGDCKRCIHLWTPTTGGKWVVDRNPFTGHRDSVEDLQVRVSQCGIALVLSGFICQ